MSEQDVWWWIARATVGTFAQTAFRMRVAGRANLPARGGALLTFNHVSVLDAIFIALPAVQGGRIVRYLALSEDLERPVLGWWLRHLRQIPVRRGMGDWPALQRIADVVAGGSLGAIAPEGTVGDGSRRRPAQKGAARVALLAGTPVIPVGIWGTQSRWPVDGLRLSPPIRPTVGVAYGPPILPQGNPRYRPDVQALTDRIMSAVDARTAVARRLAHAPPFTLPDGSQVEASTTSSPQQRGGSDRVR